jgi:hypothetical protein
MVKGKQSSNLFNQEINIKSFKFLKTNNNKPRSNKKVQNVHPPEDDYDQLAKVHYCLGRIEFKLDSPLAHQTKKPSYVPALNLKKVY